jgi:malate synthase
MGRIEKEVGSEQFHHLPYQLAGRLFEEIIANPEFEEFLTLKAYEHLE